ncbi:Na+/H+ antiporter subunit E [Phaeovulum vinaykumarii]|uniref:Multisubunit potassium/proton antiporter, PhaE subunit n=1 Tax=Phaeovulum vinaykumarii TaxID=407234 RepID=A0A1N7K191_9RHOB|nr:Na+/H+ antiporter subunit E [Phaeovulum vinaykumarii]SIS55338.1 multisubunit potassium/proton antiporter, PhaE subunit [Phaeovulum vinaykumarii]SOB92331.1 multisubunit potassium/proton antiporter PhaE subunit [Phaeovulum vinaykumarii]
MRRKLIPHPHLSLLLLVVWVMLQNRVTPGSVAMGLVLGLVIPVMTAPYWPDRPSLRGWGRMIAYALLVMGDIVRANVIVAGIVLFKRNADLRPAWVAVPLDLTSAEAITTLAGTVTMTPGTVSADLSADGRTLLVHCLHAPDPQSVIDEIKDRYERRLMEIFE